jgi:hypothetical protein
LLDNGVEVQCVEPYPPTLTGLPYFRFIQYDRDPAPVASTGCTVQQVALMDDMHIFANCVSQCSRAAAIDHIRAVVEFMVSSRVAAVEAVTCLKTIYLWYLCEAIV